MATSGERLLLARNIAVDVVQSSIELCENNWNTFEELEQKGKQLIEKAENFNNYMNDNTK